MQLDNDTLKYFLIQICITKHFLQISVIALDVQNAIPHHLHNLCILEVL